MIDFILKTAEEVTCVKLGMDLDSVLLLRRSPANQTQPNSSAQSGNLVK